MAYNSRIDLTNIILLCYLSTDLMFSVFSADNRLDTTFEPMYADTSSSFGMVISFLDI